MNYDLRCILFFWSVLIEIPCDRTTATLFCSYFTVNILSKNTRTLWPTTFWSMLVASRVNGNWHNTFCSSYMANFRSVWLQPKMLVGVRWDCGGHVMFHAVQWSRETVVDAVFETECAIRIGSDRTFGRHTWKSEHANCTISETGTYPTKMHIKNLSKCLRPQETLATNTEKVWKSNAGLWWFVMFVLMKIFFAISLYISAPTSRCKRLCTL